MYKKMFAGLVISVLVIGAGVTIMQSTVLHDWRDARVWQQMKTGLQKGLIRAELNGSVTISDRFGEAVELIRNAKYERSNRLGHGPTPENRLELFLKDGSVIRLSHWGGSTFEVSEVGEVTLYDEDAQFLIQSEPLGKWMQQIITSLQQESSEPAPAMNSQLVGMIKKAENTLMNILQSGESIGFSMYWGTVSLTYQIIDLKYFY